MVLNFACQPNNLCLVTRRDQQRAATRERIVEAAAEAFAERGYRGASTRDIAQRAGANQGLITYHFRTKDALWRAAADHIFAMLRTSLGARLAELETADPRARAREQIREYVRFAADHPELFRIMIEEGKNAGERMEWLVDTHIRPLYEAFVQAGAGSDAGFDPALLPHAHYVLAGAGSLIFAVAPECRRLTGLDPETEEAVETHAEFVARLLVP
jgi:TetR/AcrR family transcriptional regulator